MPLSMVACRPLLSASALCLLGADLFPPLGQLHLKEGEDFPEASRCAASCPPLPFEHVQGCVAGPGLCSTAESFQSSTMGAVIL